MATKLSDPIVDMLCERAGKPKNKLNCMFKINNKNYVCELYSSRGTGPGYWTSKKCKRW